MPPRYEDIWRKSFALNLIQPAYCLRDSFPASDAMGTASTNAFPMLLAIGCLENCHFCQSWGCMPFSRLTGEARRGARCGQRAKTDQVLLARSGKSRSGYATMDEGTGKSYLTCTWSPKGGLSSRLCGGRCGPPLKLVQFVRRNDKLCKTAVQTDHDFLANIDGRKVCPLYVRKARRKLSLSVSSWRFAEAHALHAIGRLRSGCARSTKGSWAIGSLTPRRTKPRTAC